MTRLGSLCTGYGGLDLAAEAVLGPLQHTWHAEVDPAASTVLAHHWPGVPNLGDLTAVDWATVAPVDVLTAGYPCQPLSLAGRRRGLTDDRWIWDDIRTAVRVLRPRLVLLENVAGHLSLGFGRVLGDLAAAGFDAEWGCFRASDVGAPHRRERVFVAAWPADAPRLGRVERPLVGSGSRPGAGGEHVGGGEPDRGLSLLPTPNAALGRGAGTPSPETATERRASGRRFLDDAVALLPTPAARGWRSGESNVMDRNARPLNEVIVNLLPTPTVADSRGTRNATAVRTAVKPTTNIAWTLSDVAHAERWGNYGPAVARWERVLGRPAPDPTEPGTKGQPRLSPRFVEWLMGLPAGWVTDLLPRNAALQRLGNGVVWQQAAYAYADLLGGAR